MEVVARPTLKPGIKLGVILRSKFQPHSRGRHAEIISNSLRFGSHAGKQRPENVGAVITGDLCGLCCRASCGACAVYGSPDVIF